MLKERYKNNETTKENTPSPLSLALWGRRWVLASLSLPRARVDLRPPLPWHNRQQQQEEGTVEPKVLAGHNDPEFHSHIRGTRLRHSLLHFVFA